MNSNPLKQYFRKPSIYIKLPSEGKYYTPDIMTMPETGELPVYPMTALDEFTVKTPDALFNGQAVVDVIHSCVPNIKNAWKINLIDLDTILIAIKVASYGEDMSISGNCPQCKEESSYEISLLNLLQSQQTIDYDSPLVFGDLSVKFRSLTFEESNKNNLYQYDLQKVLVMLENYEDTEEKKNMIQESMEKLNELMFEILTYTIDYVKTPECEVSEKEYIKEFLLNCDRNQSNAIRDYSVKLRASNEIKPMRLKCLHCEYEYDYKVELNMTNFFE